MNVIFPAKTIRTTLFFLVALFFFIEAYLTFSRSPLLIPWDFQAFWGAGRALNLGLDPYNFSNLLHLGVNAPFVSPLFLAELVQPLAHFPLMTAKMIWTGLSFLEAAITIGLLCSVSKTKLTPQSFLLGFALLMAFEPFSGTIYLGQTDMLVVFALALSWFCLERRRLFLAGLVFCLGATNPHLITGIGLYYLYRALWRREYPLLLGILTGSVVLLASLLIYFSYTKEWLTTILLAKENSEIWSVIQITLVHVFAYFLGNILPEGNAPVLLASLLALALGLIAAVFSIRFWAQSGGRSIAGDMALAVVLTLLASPFAFHQDFLILVLVAPALLELRHRGVSVHKVAFLFLCASTFFFSSLTGFINAGTNEFRLPFYFFAPLLCIVLLMTQLETRHTARQYLPWLAAFALFSLAGSDLPAIFGMPVTQYEMIGIFLGLVLFIGGMWRWHPALASKREPIWNDARDGVSSLQGSVPLMAKE